MSFKRGEKEEVKPKRSPLKVRVLQQLMAELNRQHLSRAALARKLNVSRPTVTIMLQEQNFTLDKLDEIADTLGGFFEIQFFPESKTGEGFILRLAFEKDPATGETRLVQKEN